MTKEFCHIFFLLMLILIISQTRIVKDGTEAKGKVGQPEFLFLLVFIRW